MPSGTAWTPALVAERLTQAYERWLADEEHGQLARKPFNPAYLKKVGCRPIYDQNRGTRFTAALALMRKEVREAWAASPRRRWDVMLCAKRLKELFEAWRKDVKRGQPAGGTWGLQYLRTTAPSFVRVNERKGIRIDDVIKRLGGEIRLRWRMTRPIRIRRDVRRWSCSEVAKELTRLHRQWLRDAEHGKPAGKRFGSVYLRRCGEDRLYMWMLRNGMVDLALSYAPVAVSRDWNGRKYGVRKRRP